MHSLISNEYNEIWRRYIEVEDKSTFVGVFCQIKDHFYNTVGEFHNWEFEGVDYEESLYILHECKNMIHKRISENMEYNGILTKYKWLAMHFNRTIIDVVKNQERGINVQHFPSLINL